MDLRIRENRENAVISWRPPFSLDVMEVSDDELTYCINVTNATSLESLHTVCGVTVAEFVFSLPPLSWCGEINFIITPVNLAGRGPSSEIVYVPELNREFIMLLGRITCKIIAPRIDSIQCTLIEDMAAQEITAIL